MDSISCDAGEGPALWKWTRTICVRSPVGLTSCCVWIMQEVKYNYSPHTFPQKHQDLSSCPSNKFKISTGPITTKTSFYGGLIFILIVIFIFNAARSTFLSKSIRAHLAIKDAKLKQSGQRRLNKSALIGRGRNNWIDAARICIVCGVNSISNHFIVLLHAGYIRERIFILSITY